MYVERPKGDTYNNINPNTFISDFSLVIRCKQFQQGQGWSLRIIVSGGDKILIGKKNI